MDRVRKLPDESLSDREDGEADLPEGWWDPDKPTLKAMWQRMDVYEKEQKKNTKITLETRENTAEIIEFFRSVKGAFKVLSWLATLGKWIGWIVGGGIAIWGLVKLGNPTK